ncbi:glycosyltransferase family 4 protein [Anaerorudis cellulosivorans]|uniref:glycosyltransferase family 4 protein n=1 Tax=Anaerorudis cellulosivorans TaxID=3397862 RepID=UPI00221F5E68|nr:glycosyltransferase family 4 protein [Seramator thermalis]MCW1735272.1 glycosyltransferase family 4 protein [Seramator thermalis]
MNKLLQINSVVNSGSTGRIAEEIGQTAIAAGWESYIAYGRHARTSQSELIKIGSDWDIRMHGLQTRLFDRHGLASTAATREFVEQIKKIKPDIIHLHNIHGYYINIEILFRYLKDANIPVVWTFHDCWPITGHCAYFTFVECEKWKTQCFSCPQKKDYPSSYFLDRSKQNYTKKRKLFTSVHDMTIVPVSNWLADIVKQSYLKDYPIRVINNGIDVNVFSPQSRNNVRIKYGLADKFILLGVATEWGRRKGLHDFIELSKTLKDDEIIVLVGLKEDQIKILPENIIGITRTESTQELAEFYSSADVVMNISYEETFGLTTVEGFACGTPGIVYNTTASPELVDDSTGLIVDPGDIKGLVKAITQIKEKGKQSYSEACVKRAHRLYRKEDRYREYIELYKELLNK